MTKFFLKSNMLIYMTNITYFYCLLDFSPRWYYRLIIIIHICPGMVHFISNLNNERMAYWHNIEGEILSEIKKQEYGPYELMY